MISSRNSRKAPHLLSLFVAFAVAVGMWYVVSVRDRLEVQLEVGIEYNGIPPGLVVTDGLVRCACAGRRSCCVPSRRAA